MIDQKKRYKAVKQDPIKYEKHKQRVLAAAHRKRKWYVELKSTLQCVTCGFDHPAALVFHHRDPTTKLDTVAALVAHNRSKEVILREMDKCDVLCSNCHRIHHSEERG